MTEKTEDLIADLKAYAGKCEAHVYVPAEMLRVTADALEAAEARLAVLTTPQEGDAREWLHAKCDCVPDLGPAHCHLCGNEKGEPVMWSECSAVRAAAPEPEWEYGVGMGWGQNPPIVRLAVGSEPDARAEVAKHPRRSLVRRRKAGPWLSVGDENDGD